MKHGMIFGLNIYYYNSSGAEIERRPKIMLQENIIDIPTIIKCWCRFNLMKSWNVAWQLLDDVINPTVTFKIFKTFCINLISIRVDEVTLQGRESLCIFGLTKIHWQTISNMN